MRCPVCQARFRGTRRCSRCGADLMLLMLLAVKAWRLRESARGALAEGDSDLASKIAAEAQSTHGTEAGRALRVLSSWLCSDRRC